MSPHVMCSELAQDRSKTVFCFGAGPGMAYLSKKAWRAEIPRCCLPQAAGQGRRGVAAKAQYEWDSPCSCVQFRLILRHDVP